jgi:hypothetical protein
MNSRQHSMISMRAGTVADVTTMKKETKGDIWLVKKMKT